MDCKERDELVKHYLTHHEEFARFVATILNGAAVAVGDKILTNDDTAYIYQEVRKVSRGRNYDGSSTKL